MNWLKRLEDLYLNILRVVIIVLATLLLIGAVAGAVYALPKLVPEVGKTDARKLVADDGLSDFRREQSGAAESAVSGGEESDEAVETAKIDGRIRKAAGLITKFIQARVDPGAVPAAVEQYLVEKQKALPDNLQGPYAESLLKLAQDLARTQPADLDVDQLINWHYARFTAAEEAALSAEVTRQAENQVRMIQAAATGGAALGMFMLFLLLVFSFVLVKVERNLRLLPVRLTDGPAAGMDPPAPAAT